MAREKRASSSDRSTNRGPEPKEPASRAPQEPRLSPRPGGQAEATADRYGRPFPVRVVRLRCPATAPLPRFQRWCLPQVSIEEHLFAILTHVPSGLPVWRSNSISRIPLLAQVESSRSSAG